MQYGLSLACDQVRKRNNAMHMLHIQHYFSTQNQPKKKTKTKTHVGVRMKLKIECNGSSSHEYASKTIVCCGKMLCSRI